MLEVPPSAATGAGSATSRVAWVSRDTTPMNVTRPVSKSGTPCLPRICSRTLLLSLSADVRSSNDVASPREVRGVLATKVTVHDGSGGGGSVASEYNNQASDGGGAGGVGDDAAEAVVVVSTAAATTQPTTKAPLSTTTMLNFTITAAVAINMQDASENVNSLVDAAAGAVASPTTTAATITTAATLYWESFWNRSRISLPNQPQLEAMWLGAQYNLACAAAASDSRGDAAYVPAPGLFGTF